MGQAWLVDESALRGMGARLAAAVAEELRAGRSKKWRCPAELRSQILVYGGLCRERGEPLGDIAARLGLVESTLARWLRQERSRSTAAFRPVAIVPRVEGYQAEELGGRSADLRLVTPRGYTVEGLDVEAVAALLRVVG